MHLELPVVRRVPEHDADGAWAYTVEFRGLAVDVHVAPRSVPEDSAVSWWAQRGNFAMANYELAVWAEKEARAVGMALLGPELDRREYRRERALRVE